MFLLTDGMPTCEPMRGTPAELAHLFANSQLPPLSISTFGFGYTIQAAMLESIATTGAGAFAFLPDPGMVGTVFVHAAAAALASAGQCARLTLTPLGGARLALSDDDASPRLLEAENPLASASASSSVSACSRARALVAKIITRRGLPAGLDCNGLDSLETLELDIGALVAAQTRRLVVDVRLPDAQGDPTPEDLAGTLLQASVSYWSCGVEYEAASTATAAAAPSSASAAEAAAVRARLVVLALLRGLPNVASDTPTAAKLIVAAAARLDELAEEIDELAGDAELGEDEERRVAEAARRVASLTADVRGQVMEAAGTLQEWYTRWGRFFLPSLATAHRLELCNNFKDPGVQPYAGEVFSRLRAEAEAAFTKLAPPQPSLGGPQLSPAQMASRYYNQAGGCIAGDALARLADGSRRKLRDLRKGDRLGLPGGGSATLRCLVRTDLAEPVDMVRLPGDGPLVTPYHPVLTADGSWAFPVQLAEPRPVQLDAFFNLVLDGGAMAVLDGWCCVALGHGLRGDPVVEHPYFGTARVLVDLEQLPGFEAGEVVLQQGVLLRDPATGLVVGMS